MKSSTQPLVRPLARRSWLPGRSPHSNRLGLLGLLGLAASAGLAGTSEAVVRPRGGDAPYVTAGHAPRTHRATSFQKSSSAKRSLAGLAGWTAIHDADTGVPLRLWGAGPLASGAVANAAVAEAAARRFLAEHIGVLAPGARPSDFELVSNTLSRGRDVRSVGFRQRAHGLQVLGGTIGFAFKADRLALVSSTALPHVAVTPPAPRLAPAFAEARATAWMAAAGFTVAAKPRPALAPAERVIVPIVRPRARAAADITYRVAEQVTVAATTGPGLWDVWVDATDGAPIARRSGLHYASGKILFDVPDRHPGGTRRARPSSFTTHLVNSAENTSSVDGTLAWSGDDEAAAETRLAGPGVKIVNELGPTATTNLTVLSGGTATWSMATSEAGDAQLTASIHANEIKQFAKTRFDMSLPWLGEQLSVHVNEDGVCNAYSTGDHIHFLRANEECQNTGRMADVVYHEFGHSLHSHAIIEGVGVFDGAVSEGMSDFLATLITNDSGVGRGFFLNDQPLRELNPAGTEKRWPDDATGEVHDDGEIIGGTLWDLRTLLEAKLGAEGGYEKVLDIFYAILQRSTDLPSTYAEALLVDDDDGNLANGTPNQCEIENAFGRHGLADPAAGIVISTPARDGFDISVTATPGGNGLCPGPSVTSSVVRWRKRGDAEPKELAMTPDGDTYEVAIPTQPAGTVVQYQVQVTLSNGATVRYPNNSVDPFYEFYVGPIEVIRCFGFESGLEGWTHGATPANLDEWQTGAPVGLGGDPKTAQRGTGVLGMDLDGDGHYASAARTYAESPEIDLGGHKAVRLQLHRWLGVEDGTFDHARILVNGTELWSNAVGTGSTHHVDKEWRFADFDLATHATAGKLKLRFELEADEIVELGGWTLDDVCVVSTDVAPACGDGALDAGETCDDGNVTDGDGCSATCTTEPPSPPGDGDGDGDGGGGETGCCSTGGGPAGSLAMSALVLGLALRRRRRRPSASRAS